MLIDNVNDLKTAVLNKTDNFEVVKEAFEFCDEVRRSLILGSANDWSIVATNGWMAIFTNFNHNIHRLFMNQDKKDREDIQHVLAKEYIIKKTDVANKYELILRK